jgi:hypothetical protein
MNQKILRALFIITSSLMIMFCSLISRIGESGLDSEASPEGVEGSPEPTTQMDPNRDVTRDEAIHDNDATDHLTPADFSYQGAFRLPSEFDWGARGISYYPGGDNGAGTLLVTGFEARPAEFGEVTIPTPVIEADWLALPVSELLQPVRSFDGALIEEQLDPTTTFAGDIEYVPKQGSQISDKVYGSADWWYAVVDSDFPSIWFSELDGSNPRGLFHVGSEEDPFHGNRTGDYLFTLPQWYADQYFGGRSLVTGKTRGTENGSQGPALYAFRPWDSENPAGNLDAVPIIWYRFVYPDCAGPNVGDKSACDYPDFTMCDKWVGGSFVENEEKSAVIILGVKGLGENGYGQPTSPEACNPYQGYHCDPLERQVIFYDVHELGQAAQGKRDAWSVVPYDIWRPEEFYLGKANGTTCGEAGGMAFDPQTGRVFMVEKGLGDNNAAVVHVWEVKE